MGTPALMACTAASSMACRRAHDVYELARRSLPPPRARTGNRVRNIVEFQVEEYAGTQSRNLFDGCGASSSEELVAILTYRKIGDLLCELHRRDRDQIGERQSGCLARMSVNVRV